MKELRVFLDGKTKDLSDQVQETMLDSEIKTLKKSMKFKLGIDSAENLILKEDTWVELGSPRSASVSIILPVTDSSKLNAGKMTLIGPDIPESRDEELDFGLIILLGGSKVNMDKYKKYQRTVNISNRLEGFLVRSVPRKLWCRVGINSARNGFKFQDLSKALMITYLEKFPEIQAMEIYILTSQQADVRLLEKVGARIHSELSKPYVAELFEKYEKEIKRREDCDFEWECNACVYTEVCDEIEDMIKRMRKYREERAKK